MAKLESIDSNKFYKVAGNELIDLDEEVHSIIGDINWLRNYFRDALELVNRDNNSIPMFIARVGMGLANIDNFIARYNNKEITHLGCGMEMEEIKEK